MDVSSLLMGALALAAMLALGAYVAFSYLPSTGARALTVIVFAVLTLALALGVLLTRSPAPALVVILAPMLGISAWTARDWFWPRD